jgi:CubicO group peptidase (beta-lactamase class C family)
LSPENVAGEYIRGDEVKMKHSKIILMRAISLSAVFSLASVGFVFPQGSTQVDRLAGLSQYVENKMEEWKIPGMAIGVIQNDTIIFLKGFGLRDVDKKLSVTPQTLFGIASISKGECKENCVNLLE